MNQWIREFIAECLGTMILITLGNGAVAVTVITKTPNIVGVGLGYGIGLLIAASLAAPVSGAHLNPAVTVALCAIRKFQWKKVIVYITAQYLGGFLGAALVYGIYYQGIKNVEYDLQKIANQTNTPFSRVSATAGIFATYPQEYVGVSEVLADQVVSCAILMIAVLAITDEKGINTPRALQPISLALVIAALIISYGLNCGATLNPARDLSPRIFTAIAGYGFDVFKPLDYHYWWTAGLAAPHLGAIIGGWLYSLAIGMHNNKDSSNSSVSTLSSNSHTIPITKNDVMYERARQVINENMKATPTERDNRF